MKCRDKGIKEMLPQYLSGELDRDARAGVEGHLNVCVDCRAEMDVLRALSSETVPDPGEGFWAGMPGRIRRACLQEKEKGKGFREKLRPPVWAWAGGVAAAAVVFVVALWPNGIVRNDTAVDLYSADDYIYEYADAAGAVSLNGLEGGELDALASWAGDELEAAGEEAAIALADGTAGGFYEEFSDMDAQELESFSRMLDKAKQEV